MWRFIEMARERSASTATASAQPAVHAAVMNVTRVLWLAAGLIGLAAVLSGCATTTESDMPWNAPQSWEGSPYVPGMSSPRY